MTQDLRDRVRGAVLGQAIGDALGAPTEGMPRTAIRQMYGRVTGFVSDDPAGTDDTEYAVLTAQTLLKYGQSLTPEDVSAEWERRLVHQTGGFKGGGFSEMVAIRNLARGLRAPATGSDNHEMWSDGTAMRVAPVGAYAAGDPGEAARLAGIDAEVSHARDGIFCGQAIAAAVAAAAVSDNWREVVAAGLAAVPQDSWSARSIAKAVEIADSPAQAEERLDALEQQISIFPYPWADVAPEATALAFGVFVVGAGDYVDSVLGGVNIGRDADTIAAMAGAMAGALHGFTSIPAEWSSRITEIRGSCISDTAGVRLLDLADEIYESSPIIRKGVLR